MTQPRDQLIRRHFEAMRDLIWAETLEPKFREYRVDAATMKTFREAWNHYAEKRDWAWWQNEAKSDSNDHLEDMLMDCFEKLDAIGMLQWKRDNRGGEQEKFHRILEGRDDKEEKRQEPSRTRDDGMEM